MLLRDDYIIIKSTKGQRPNVLYSIVVWEAAAVSIIPTTVLTPTEDEYIIVDVTVQDGTVLDGMFVCDPRSSTKGVLLTMHHRVNSHDAKHNVTHDL